MKLRGHYRRGGRIRGKRHGLGTKKQDGSDTKRKVLREDFDGVNEAQRRSHEIVGRKKQRWTTTDPNDTANGDCRMPTLHAQRVDNGNDREGHEHASSDLDAPEPKTEASDNLSGLRVVGFGEEFIGDGAENQAVNHIRNTAEQNQQYTVNDT